MDMRRLLGRNVRKLRAAAAVAGEFGKCSFVFVEQGLKFSVVERLSANVAECGFETIKLGWQDNGLCDSGCER